MHIDNTGLIVSLSTLRFICLLHCAPNRATVQWPIVSRGEGCFSSSHLRSVQPTLPLCQSAYCLSFTVCMNDKAAAQCCGVNGQARTRSERGHFHNYIHSESLVLKDVCVCVCVSECVWEIKCHKFPLLMLFSANCAEKSLEIHQQSTQKDFFNTYQILLSTQNPYEALLLLTIIVSDTQHRSDYQNQRFIFICLLIKYIN